MKSIAMIVSFFLMTSQSVAAQKNQLYAEGSLLFPLSIPIGENNSTGYGIGLSAQHFFAKNWSFDMNAGYIYFSGEVTDWNGNQQNHFGLVPVSIGVRYYLKNFFGGLHAGFAVKGSNNTGTNLMFSPFVGYRVKKFQFEVKLLGIPQTFATYPEKTYLQKGGYSYVGFGIKYHLN
jgi:hypothetical protein